MYRPDQWEILSEINSVACVTAISLVFGRKIAGVEGPVYYARGIVLAYYTLAWVFVTIACMVVSTNNGNMVSCQLGYYNVVIIYSLSKVLMYCYLVEKVFFISVPKLSRRRSPLYLIGVALLLPYIALIILMVMGKVIEQDSEAPYHCTIGYSLMGSIPVLCYDFFLTSLSVAYFVKAYYFPNAAQTATNVVGALKIKARRNMIASIVACVASIINHLFLILLGGHERGLVILTVCALHLTIVACVLHWVTSHPVELRYVEHVMPKGGGDKPLKLEIKQHQEVVILTEFNGRT